MAQVIEHNGKTFYIPEQPEGLDPAALLPKSFTTAEKAARRYAETPSYKGVPRGRSAHVGGGVWRTVCPECDHYVDHYGSMPQYATVGEHAVAEHGSRIAGINVGMLA